MKTVLALDQGTTSSRAILFGPDGSPLAVAQQEFTQHFPQPGWVEHCPNEIWSTQAAVAREARRQAGITPGEIAALGITNQRETTVVWNRHSGEPITNAIVWQDRRTAPICDDLRHQGLESRFHEKTGLLLDPYFAGTKLKWILDHIPNARQQAEHGELLFGTIDSWLLWKLTDGRCHATDVSNASRTLLCDLETGDWDSGLLELLGIPAGMLPEIRPSSGNYGEATTLFSQPIPIAGVAGDQQAALFGQGCHQPGMAKNTYGTGCFLLLNTGTRLKRSQHRLLTTVGWQIGQRREYALEGSIFIGGAVVQWLRDALGIIRSSSEIEALAAQAPDSEGVYFVPAFSGLGAPHWDAYARGTLVGLTRGTTAAHIARAALEGIAFQVLDVIQAMEADSGLAIPELRVDGGATANNFLMQFQADILGLPVARPKWAETTALGAAYLAGLGIGFWKDLEEVAAQWHLERRFEPQMDPSERERRYHGWQKALSRAKGWIES